VLHVVNTAIVIEVTAREEIAKTTATMVNTPVARREAVVPEQITAISQTQRLRSYNHQDEDCTTSSDGIKILEDGLSIGFGDKDIWDPIQIQMQITARGRTNR
jgi:hypothetical protein